MLERPLVDSDKTWLTEEIANDPEHRAWMQPQWFNAPNSLSVCIEDEHGPLFVVRYSNVLRADIQFCRKQASRRRIVTGFMKEFPKVIANARARGYKQLIVKTQAASLIRWCEKHLGFEKLLDNLVKYL